jgi:hypothetical protein
VKVSVLKPLSSISAYLGYHKHPTHANQCRRFSHMHVLHYRFKNSVATVETIPMGSSDV